MKEIQKLTWQEVYDACDLAKEKYGIKPYTKVFGMPGQGSIIAGLMSSLYICRVVESADQADMVLLGQCHCDPLPYPTFKLFEDREDIEIVYQFPWEKDHNEDELEENIRAIIKGIGDNPSREGLRDTPRRYLKFLKEFCNYPAPRFTTFSAEDYDQMIVVKDIEFYSLCEHHIAPFFGKAHVAYIPDQKIVGLSKIPRTVKHIAQGLQNQERITSQVANMLQASLHPKGVAVVLEAKHLCMCMRGVESPALTRTSALLGAFHEDNKTRSEFFNLIS